MSGEDHSAGPPVGMLVGGGALPLEIARCILARGQGVHVVAIRGEADQDWSGISHTTIGWGEIGGMLAALKGARCRDLVIIGRVRRPDPWRIRPDLGFFLHLPKILRLITAGGDDSLLRRVVRFFEGQGLHLQGPAQIVPELVAGEGAAGQREPGAGQLAQAELGLRVLAALGPFDVGQAVAVAAGRLIAIEGVEGTDALIARLPEAAAGGVLVKAAKPGQELRVDMPVIGPKTIEGVASAGLAGIAVAAGEVLMAERAGIVEMADAAGVFVFGIAIPARAGDRPRRARGPRMVAASGTLTARQAIDAGIAAGVVDALAPFCTSATAAVARRHVLAVGVDEGVPALATRVAEHRQWGDRGRWRRRGVLAIAAAADVTPAAIAAVGERRLAGVVVPRAAAGPAVIETAHRCGLFVAVRAATGETP